MQSSLHRLGLLVVGLLLSTLANAPIQADDKRPPKRELLYPAKLEEVPDSLKPFVAKLLAPDQGPVDPSTAKPMGVFARVVSKGDVVDAKVRKEGGTLGSKPFVFTTLPEALYGRDLLEIFSAIGYSAESVLTSQIGVEKAVIVFRWNEKVALHDGRDGSLPKAWQSAVYPATWDNVFSLVDKMCGDDDWNYVPDGKQPPVFTKLKLNSPQEKQFLLGFPNEGKQRIKTMSYYALRDAKGANWEYRQFLERSMSLAEHYSGDGTSTPTALKKDQAKLPVGFPEFLGPNRKMTTLTEVAVIGLGSLRLENGSPVVTEPPTPPTTQPNFNSEWMPYIPLLALAAGLAGYVGTIRLWFHKLRMDSVDAIKKAEAETDDAKKKSADHAKKRIGAAVWWLRGLMVLDVGFLILAIIVYKRAFKRWLPGSNWISPDPSDDLAFVIRLGLVAICCLCIAHVLACASAWYRSAEYGKNAHLWRAGLAAVPAFVLLVFAVTCW